MVASRLGQAILRNSVFPTRERALALLLPWRQPEHEPMLAELFGHGFSRKEAFYALTYARLARQWQPARLQDSLWPLIFHPSAEVRDEASHTLSCLGDELLPTLTEYVTHKQAEVREAGARVLARLTSPTARALLQGRLAQEKADEVWRTLVPGLGRPLTLEEARQRVQTARKGGRPAFLSGDVPGLTAAESEFVLSQSIHHPAALPLLDLIQSDEVRAGEWLSAFVGSKQEAKFAWVLELVGRLGSVADALTAQLEVWAQKKRVDLAEAAIRGLAQIPALSHLERLERTAHGRIAAAATTALEQVASVA